jgi:hypothetical protein
MAKKRLDAIFILLIRSMQFFRCQAIDSAGPEQDMSSREKIAEKQNRYEVVAAFRLSAIRSFRLFHCQR